MLCVLIDEILFIINPKKTYVTLKIRKIKHTYGLITYNFAPIAKFNWVSLVPTCAYRFPPKEKKTVGTGRFLLCRDFQYARYQSVGTLDMDQ